MNDISDIKRRFNVGKRNQKYVALYGKYDLFTTDYQRFKVDNNRTRATNATIEYLYVLEKQ